MNAEIPKNNKVLLGLSGGVDSTAAALLLKEKGLSVTGLFFDVLGNQSREAEAAEQAASELGIPFIYKDASKEFERGVIEPFCQSYLAGETPNPCILCNPTIKFRILKEEADRIGAYYLATGHYAGVTYDEALERFFVTRGASGKKDQSYMLYRLDQSVLSRLLLPLGQVEEKDDARQLVREQGIYNADKKDSQEICFIKEGSYVDYIESRNHESTCGNFVDLEGNILGKHQGLLHYTIGQRKGLGITFGKPTFVVAMDAQKNEVILGEDKDLFNSTVFVNDCRFSLYSDGLGPLPQEYEGKAVLAKIRYAALPAQGILEKGHKNNVKIIFEKPQRAAALGQSVVFYDGARLLGGGFIAGAE